MELYIVRHGRTHWNAIHRIQGSSDIELIDEGREMARQTAKGLQQIDFDAIYASPLKRAYETAQIIKGERDLEVQTDDRIREMSFGILEGEHTRNINFEDVNAEHGCFFLAPERYEKPDGGEDFYQLTERATDFIEDLKSRHGVGEKVLVVAHGAVNKAMLKYIKGLELKDFWAGSLQKNCAVTIIKVNQNDYEIIEEGKYFY